MPFIDPLNLNKPYGMSKIAIPYQQPIQTIRRVGRLRPTVKFRKIKWVVKNPSTTNVVPPPFRAREASHPHKNLYRHKKAFLFRKTLLEN
jgi:hypothetical protein